MSTVATTPTPVMDLLADFARLPGCERYANDGDRIKLLEIYLLVRQLAPGLTIEVFLERFAAIADYDETNFKLPADAIHHFCPRSKKIAEPRGVPQWAANEVVDLLVLYCDAIREAEQTGQEVDLTTKDWCEFVGPSLKTGAVQPPAPATPRRRGKASQPAPSQPAVTQPTAQPATGQPAAAQQPAAQQPATEPPAIAAVSQTPEKLAEEAMTGVITNPQAPTVAGQRVIYTMQVANGRQIKGTVQRIWQEVERVYVDLQTDTGELYLGLSALDCAVVFEQGPVLPTPTERRILFIPKAKYPTLVQLLNLRQAAGNTAVGEPLESFMQPLTSGDGELVIDLHIINGENGPYVEATLARGKDIVAEIVGSAPRQNLLGEYRFVYGEHYIVLDVRVKE